MSCIFCHSLDASHSEEPATSGVDSMEESSDECNSDVSVSDTDSVYVPTPERPVAIKVSRTDLPNGVTIMEVSQLEKFVRKRGRRGVYLGFSRKGVRSKVNLITALPMNRHYSLRVGSIVAPPFILRMRKLSYFDDVIHIG